MESVVEYRRIIHDHTPESIKRIGATVANIASATEIATPILMPAEGTEEQIIDTETSRASLRASVARFGGCVALLGINTAGIAIEHGVINTASTILEPALIASSGLLASVANSKKQALKSAYESVYDLLYVARHEQDKRSKFQSIYSDKLGSLGEALGVDGIDFAGAFEGSFKRAAMSGKRISASAVLKSRDKTEKFKAEDVLAVRPSTKFGHFNLVLNKQKSKTTEYRAIKEITYKEMQQATASLSYSKTQSEAIDKKANPLYTLPLLRTSVFINLKRKGRRVLSKVSTR